MGHCIADKSAFVLIVEPQQARRSMLAEGFKRLGFTKVNSVPTIKDVFGFTESEENPPDWIITGLLEDHKENGFHLLVPFLEDERLHNCRISFVLDAEQTYCLPKAFSLGLFSWHSRFPDPASQMAALSDIMARGEEEGWDDCQIAASYLRDYLKDQNLFEDVELLEKRLLTIYPDQPALTLRMAEALFLGGKHQAAQKVLDRAQGLVGEVALKAETLGERIQASMPSDSSTERRIAVKNMGINSAVIVDSDESVRNMVRDALIELGIQKIHDFGDGESAWAFMSNKDNKPGIIIQEWRLPKVGGDVLVQRARMNGLGAVPIVVYSSLVKNKDRLLLREVGVTDVLEKPLPPARLASSLHGILKEEQRPKTAQTMERQIRAALTKGDTKGARKILATLMQTENNANGKKEGQSAEVTKLILDAEITFYEGDLSRANDVATQALLLGGDDALVLNLLGKINMRLGQNDTAIKYFDQAQKLSPQNLGRLLFLAEAQAGADKKDDANATIDKAKKLDAGNDRVAETEAKVALANGETERAKSVMASVGGTPNIVAFINNRAVLLVSQNRVAESVELYHSALKALPKNAKNVRPIVSYNLALASLRLGDSQGALKALEANPDGFEPSLTAKIQSLLARTKKAIATGEPVKLNLEPVILGQKGAATAVKADGADARIGSLRCYKVYEPKEVDPKVAKLMPQGAAYKGRKAIQKGQAGKKAS